MGRRVPTLSGRVPSGQDGELSPGAATTLPLFDRPLAPERRGPPPAPRRARRERGRPRDGGLRAMPDFAAAAFLHLFPSPFMAFVWPDAVELNEEMRVRILEHAAASAGTLKTNVGGWHSESGQLEFCGAAGRRLVRHMYEMADEATRRTLAEQREPPRAMRWTLAAWANVNPPGGFNRMHTHPGSTWSGTYYVDTGAPADAENGTPLNFFDPCQGRANTFLQPMLNSSYAVGPSRDSWCCFRATCRIWCYHIRAGGSASPSPLTCARSPIRERRARRGAGAARGRGSRSGGEGLSRRRRRGAQFRRRTGRPCDDRTAARPAQGGAAVRRGGARATSFGRRARGDRRRAHRARPGRRGRRRLRVVTGGRPRPGGGLFRPRLGPAVAPPQRGSARVLRPGAGD